ncbi:Phosphoinositide phospholipase C 3 (Phosphoinositide phospholipase PLC3) (AtPLC1F) (AtPLC3) (PI-PLC3) [Durusdinium trenchii]|uniref:Phosphoinositide phospholipase C n=1 Tax=Durusdinium trenchii TaxID=1381693 RepID=A0ABP0I9V9_9DINO
MQGPCVLHGGTATTAVSFQACLEAIRDAAFETSACPVIITLENYLSQEGATTTDAFLAISWRAMRRYTAVHLARIYPAGYRVDSSNYDPQDAWDAGCQMVALNGQKSIFFHPHAAWLNAGKFRGNGGCGFVQKPLHLLSDDPPKPKRLLITVLGGDGWEAFRDFDLLGPPDSYVCVEIAGASSDRRLEKTSVYTARVKTGPKAQPVWKQCFEFAITDMALAVVMLVAWDQDVDFDDLLGQYAFPLAELKPGWRRSWLHACCVFFEFVRVFRVLCNCRCHIEGC